MIAEPVHFVERDEVHDGVFPGEELGYPLHLGIAVVDILDQRPLILDRMVCGARIRLGAFHQFFDGDLRRIG